MTLKDFYNLLLFNFALTKLTLETRNELHCPKESHATSLSFELVFPVGHVFYNYSIILFNRFCS